MLTTTTGKNRQGAQGKLDKASKATLENAFGKVSEEDIIKRILKEGQYQLANVSHKNHIFYLSRIYMYSGSIN